MAVLQLNNGDHVSLAWRALRVVWCFVQWGKVWYGGGMV